MSARHLTLAPPCADTEPAPPPSFGDVWDLPSVPDAEALIAALRPGEALIVSPSGAARVERMATVRERYVVVERDGDEVTVEVRCATCRGEGSFARTWTEFERHIHAAATWLGPLPAAPPRTPCSDCHGRGYSAQTCSVEHADDCGWLEHCDHCDAPETAGCGCDVPETLRSAR